MSKKLSECNCNEKKKWRNYFISSNRYWDLWMQKLFSQIISIKVWVLAIAVIMRGLAWLTGGELITIFLTVLALKGTYEIVDVFKGARISDSSDDEPSVVEYTSIDNTENETLSIQRMLKGV